MIFFNDYILYNYKILLEKNLLSERTIVWYVRYIYQFYNNEICKNYGTKCFPYITLENIEYIKKNFSEEKKSLNLITTLKIQ